jgi:hypothetical protein
MWGINGHVDNSDGMGYRGDSRLAEVWSFEGNAHLIAAAPELLEACKLAIPWLSKAIESGAFSECAGPSVADRALEAMIAAIAKAEGEQA